MVQAININQNNPMQSHRATWGISTPAVVLPAGERDYCLFNQTKVNFIISQKEHALPQLKETLQNPYDENEVIEALYIVDKLADGKTKGIPAMYQILAKYNDTKSPQIQSLLAGIYRKTQVPDAFGPLVAMLVKNATDEKEAWKLRSSEVWQNSEAKPPNLQTSKPPFDPNEEIGGAILAYIENYSHNPSKIDYSA